MGKFLTGAIIGGLIAYVGHRALMSGADAFIKSTEQSEKKD